MYVDAELMQCLRVANQTHAECQKEYTMPTKLWKDDEIFCVALWTQDLRGAVTALFFIDPPLQAHLVNPTICSAAPAWSYPQCIAVIFLRSKANPARPAPTNTSHTASLNLAHEVVTKLGQQMSSKLHLDVCDHSQWWRHLVNIEQL